jgi:hypothetical protein
LADGGQNPDLKKEEDERVPIDSSNKRGTRFTIANMTWSHASPIL